MPSARNFFTSQEQQLLLEAIARAEQNTSGEIRLHVEDYCPGEPLTAAHKVFSKLNMHHTRERNGVLFYLAVKSRKIAVYGDAGIHEKLGQEFWNRLVAELIRDFKADAGATSLAKGIELCGEKLGTFFPRQKNDTNELSNDLSF